MKHYKNKIRLILILLSACTFLFAVQANPKIIIKTQSDGTQIKIRLSGDEWESYSDF
jgi:hypothetical protein